MQFVLLEDLVIPRGTVFSEAPERVLHVSDHVQADVALGPDNTIAVTVPVEHDSHFNQMFTVLKL